MPSLNMQRPIPHTVYTLKEITKLYLRDSPALMCTSNSAVQDSHITEKELLSVPGIENTKWKYIRETNEWIPIFTYCSDEPWETYFDSEPYRGCCPSTNGDSLWITPKGFPRDQDE